jgi:hypothetical protein
MQRKLQERMDSLNAQQIDNQTQQQLKAASTYSQGSSLNNNKPNATDSKFEKAKSDCAKLFKSGTNQYSNCVMKLME